jgi:hypothetical protein
VRLVLAILVVGISGCVIPFAIPPMKGEIGGATRVGRGGEGDRSASALHAAVGTHLASGTTSTRQRFDVGAGYLYEGTRETATHGAYLDAAVFIDRTRSTRTSVGVRGEARWLDEGHAAAAKLRIDTELYAGGQSDFSGSDKCGSIGGSWIGTTAIGVFVEGGRVWAPDRAAMSGGDAWVATAGVSLRLPTALGVWIGIPGC